MLEREVEYTTAKLAAEKGFDERDCTLYMSKSGNKIDSLLPDPTDILYYIPRQSHLQSWLRNKLSIILLINNGINDEFHYKFKFPGLKFKYSKLHYKTYEIALEEGLKKVLENI